MNKVALIIIYNHQYNKNIDILETIYKDRFSNIYHLIPFYYGEKQNVIPVYECSFYFQGYISQGLKTYFKKEYTHYFFVADDLILNPIINENNYAEHFKLNKNTCFIPNFVSLHDRQTYILNEWWPRVNDAYYWNIKFRGVEAKNQIPFYDEALEKFKKFNLSINPLQFNQIWKTPKTLIDFGKIALNDKCYFFRRISSFITRKKYHLSYPMVGSYSDIFIISSNTIKDFCHYCGVFAATNLFVEVALPTSLVLSAEEIITEKQLVLQGKALWDEEQYKELKKYSYSLKKLLEEFPKKYIYLHPIKLSKWDTKM
jgi:hypothetical protein